MFPTFFVTLQPETNYNHNMKRILTILFELLLTVSAVSTALAQQDIALDGEWQMTIGGKDYAVNVPHTPGAS